MKREKTNSMYKKAKFSQDFSDKTEPIYTGYYRKSENNFPNPLFTKAIAKKITDRYNRMPKHWDKFEWVPGGLLWFQYGIDGYILIRGEKISHNGKSITVYAIGHGSWSWEHENI